MAWMRDEQFAKNATVVVIAVMKSECPASRYTHDMRILGEATSSLTRKCRPCCHVSNWECEGEGEGESECESGRHGVNHVRKLHHLLRRQIHVNGKFVYECMAFAVLLSWLLDLLLTYHDKDVVSPNARHDPKRYERNNGHFFVTENDTVHKKGDRVRYKNLNHAHAREKDRLRAKSIHKHT